MLAVARRARRSAEYFQPETIRDLPGTQSSALCSASSLWCATIGRANCEPEEALQWLDLQRPSEASDLASRSTSPLLGLQKSTRIPLLFQAAKSMESMLNGCPCFHFPYKFVRVRESPRIKPSSFPSPRTYSSSSSSVDRSSSYSYSWAGCWMGCWMGCWTGC